MVPRSVANRFLATIELVLGSAERGGYRVALIGGFALPFHGVQRTTGDVDFLVDGIGADRFLTDLGAAGYTIVHRSPEVANLTPPGPSLAPCDALFAHRPATLAMLKRAKTVRSSTGVAIPLVDVEGIIGLKAQAIANDPARRRHDEDDMIRLLTAHPPDLDLGLLREYFRLLDMSDVLEGLLDEARKRRS